MVVVAANVGAAVRGWPCGPVPASHGGGAAGGWRGPRPLPVPTSGGAGRSAAPSRGPRSGKRSEPVNCYTPRSWWRLVPGRPAALRRPDSYICTWSPSWL